jgi:hypothetical protein
MEEKEYLRFMDYLYSYLSDGGIDVEAFINEDEAKYIIKEYKRLSSAILKFNGGAGAIICSGCGVIIREGLELTKEDLKAMSGKLGLEAQYCDNCKIEKRKKFLNK